MVSGDVHVATGTLLWPVSDRATTATEPISIRFRKRNIPRLHICQIDPHPGEMSHDVLNDRPAFFAELVSCAQRITALCF